MSELPNSTNIQFKPIRFKYVIYLIIEKKSQSQLAIQGKLIQFFLGWQEIKPAQQESRSWLGI